MRYSLLLLLAIGCNRDSLPSAPLDAVMVSDLTIPPDLAAGPFDLAATCALASTNADVSAYLPSDGGAFTFHGRYAWVWYGNGGCQDLGHLRVSASPSIDVVPGELYLDVAFQQQPTAGLSSTIGVDAIVDSRVLVKEQGHATFTMAGDRTTVGVDLAGTLTAFSTGANYPIQGAFSAPHCALLDRDCN